MPDSPIFARCDTLVLWVLQATVRYPRHYRAALGKATQEAALRLQRELVAAARRREKRPALQAADEALHELLHLQETFSDVVKTDKTGLSKTAHTRWMISAFANFLPGSTIFRLA